jgi:squalene-hopene/tetraprenyl-beta-curcumene cyclase
MRVLIIALMATTASAEAVAAENTRCPTIPPQAREPGNPSARNAAQRGLGWLAGSAADWTKQNGCFGCHVQAVTLEALTVGRHNQYDVPMQSVQGMVRAMLLGVTAGGHKTGSAFQGAAWARYDQWYDAEHTSELLKYGHELLGYQRPDGSIEDDDRRPPVVAGTIQTTFQAMQTWRQAYARTADETWLVPMRRAEAYLTSASASWTSAQSVPVYEVSYALMGMLAAGVRSSEPGALKLEKNLLARQNKDGGWGLTAEKSDAFATGQVLYALKLSGMTERESSIEHGIGWLIAHQKTDGSWHTVASAQNGADKGEAMWAVLGLVSVDVMSIVADGIRDGQHVSGVAKIAVEAVDNLAGGIGSVGLSIDDRTVASACGPKLSFSWDAKNLAEGKHLIDIVATNAKGKTATRRFEVYAGDVYITNVGVRFDEGRQVSEASLRNISEGPGTIRFEVYTIDKNGKAAAKVYATQKKGELGAMSFVWNGQGDDKKTAPRGRYLARLSFVGQNERVVQQETSVFFHDTASVQHDRFGEVEGKITWRKGSAQSANTLIELVDEKGHVVQSTRSTEQGNYRFKNVDGGKYKVRVTKDGFETKEASVAPAAKAAPAAADVDL